jgi:hypothetical protein
MMLLFGLPVKMPEREVQSHLALGYSPTVMDCLLFPILVVAHTMRMQVHQLLMELNTEEVMV